VHTTFIGSAKDALEAPSYLLATVLGRVQPEPVSPELVLVDPALAERERARLVEQARLAELDVRLLRRAVEHDVAAADGHEPSVDAAPRRDLRVFARQKLLPVALGCSLFANGILASMFVVRADGGQAAADASPAPAQVTVTAVGTVAPAPTPPTPSRKLSEKGVAEQKLVALMLRSPAGKLPRKFVDPTTGLVRNNMRVVCTRSRPKTYLCRVALPGDPPNAGLLVRYRPGPHGKERYTWYGYRRAAGASRSLPKS
jgi:hypothetical protein